MGDHPVTGEDVRTFDLVPTRTAKRTGSQSDHEIATASVRPAVRSMCPGLPVNKPFVSQMNRMR